MRRAGTHLGRVDDGGRTVGVVALEDVLERLIGDVRDAAAERRRIDESAATRAGRAAATTGAGAGGR